MELIPHQNKSSPQVNGTSKYEAWFHNKWRPAIGWIYAVTIFFDFVLAPVVFSSAQVFSGADIVQWSPITLEGNGLFHISSLTIVGITAYGRTREKLKEASTKLLKED